MKKTFTLTLIMLLTCLLSANATKKYADLSADQSHGNGTWTASTKKFAWTASSNAYFVLNGLEGNLSEYTSLVLETSDYTASFRLDFVYEGINGKDSVLRGRSGEYGSAFYSSGTKTVDLAKNLAGLTDTQKQNIKAVRINTNSDSGSITISKAYLQKPFTTLSFTDDTAAIDITDLAVTGADYDDQTGVITSTGTSGTISVSLPTGGIDLSEIGNIKVSVDGTDVTDYAIIKNNGTQIFRPYGTRFNMNLMAKDVTGKDRNAVTELYWHINKNGTMTIKSISLAKGSCTITIGENNYATFVTPSPLDFTNSEVKAYKVTYNSSISYEQITKVPANTAILVYASTATNYTIPFTTYVEHFTDNSLQGSVKETTTSTTADGTQYILAKGEQGLGWYQAKSGTTIAAGKGYLVISNASTAKPFFALDGTVTGINSVKSVERRVKNQNDAVYNLSGQRVGSNYKGIVIKNGRKVMQ